MPQNSQSASAVAKECVECFALFKVLRGDVSEALRQLDLHQTQYCRRVVVRTFFSLVEGLTFKLRLIAGHAVKSGLLQLSKDECESLNNDRLDFKRATRLAFELLPKAMNVDFKPNFQSAEWSALLEAQAIRNRITHPTTVTSLNISTREFSLMRRANKWLELNFNGLNKRYLRQFDV